MNNFLRVVSVLPFAALLIAPAIAQQAVAPPPKPADSGPSLTVTMQFIQERLNVVGMVTFVMRIQDTVDPDTTYNPMKSTYQVHDLVADPSQCQIAYHTRIWNDLGAAPLYDLDRRFSLAEVQEVVIEPVEQYQNEIFASVGNVTQKVVSSDPPVTVLVIHRRNVALAESDHFYIPDANLADRFAKAITHAVELCGGVKEPF